MYNLKNKIDELAENHMAFNKAHFFIILITLFLFSWFCQPITDTFDEYFVTNVCKYIYNHPLNDLLGVIYLIIVFVAGFLLFAEHNPLKYKATSLLIALLLFVCIVYGYERFISYHYVFLKLFQNTLGNYAPSVLDPVFLIALLFAIGYILSVYNTKYLKDEVSSINADQAIFKKDDDEFDRKDFVEQFAKRIDGLKINSSQSFVIGINGNWGYGKSSLLKMIANEFKRDFVKIEFNPWIANKEYNLIKDFFNTMEEELSKFIATSNLFKKYGQSLTKIDDDKNPFKKFSDFFEENTLQQRFEEITLLIKKIHKPVYIFIDDIDRLDKEEVFEILRLIRSSACFPNMVFIIAYDRKYIEKALEYNSIPDSNRYLEKIIQLEIKLPTISKIAIKNSLIRELTRQMKLINLDENLERDTIKMLEDIIFGRNDIDQNKKYNVSEVLNQIFFNKRDIVRFANSFILRLSLFFNRTYLPDLFLIEIIKFYEPNLYDKISFIEDNYYAEYRNGTVLRILSLVRNQNDSVNDEPKLLAYLDYNYEDVKRKVLTTLINNLVSEPLMSDRNQEFGIYYEDYYESYFSLVPTNHLVTTAFIQNLISQ